MPGGYERRWTDVYQKYIAFSNSQGPNHSSRTLVTRIAAHGQRLTTELGNLENYYWLIEPFLEAARVVKANLPSRELLRKLNLAQEKLEGQNLIAYHRASLAAGAQISAIAARVDEYTDEPPGQQESELLRALFEEIRAISFGIGRDFSAYVAHGPATLLALRNNPPMKTSIDNV
jgi:hypothetical protein